MHAASGKTKSKAMSERTVPPAVRQALVLEILGKIAHLECDETADMIGTLVRTVHDQYPSTHEGAQHAGLTALLEICLLMEENVDDSSSPPTTMVPTTKQTSADQRTSAV